MKHLAFVGWFWWLTIVFDTCLFLPFLYCVRYANRPDQWRSRQASKQSTYKEFYAAFGSGEAMSSKSDSFLSDTSKSTSLAIGVKNVRKEIDHHLASSEKYAKHTVVDDVMKVKNKKHEKGHGGASDEKATGSVNQKPFLSVDLKKNKRHGQEERSKASRKKLKVWWYGFSNSDTFVRPHLI